jgi:hypothetical protein
MSTKTTKLSFEFIWRGRTHLGDEPGIYGDAYSTGLCTEWPMTVRKFDPASASDGSARIRLEAEDVGIFAPYPGHKVAVARFVPDPSTENPFRWRKLVVDATGDVRLRTNQIEIDVPLPGDVATVYLSVRLEIDTTLQPGLYDDFVATRLSMLSATHFGSLGFDFEQDSISSRSRGPRPEPR